MFAQEPSVSLASSQELPADSVTLLIQGQDTFLVIDSIPIDSMQVDSLSLDSINEKKAVIEDPINYSATDSMIVSIDSQKVFLYNNATVTYQNIELTAYYICLDFQNKELYAEGIKDSTGELTQKPIFKQGEEEYESETMRYNFDTEKAYITKVITTQGDGYIHSDRSKKIGKDVFITKDAKYTTCDAEHPHFYLCLTKAKVINKKVVVTGPAYMVLCDFPIYFPFLPFGYFPSTPTYSSGIILPSYGEENSRGFFLRDGGYYWAASQYFDLTVLGDMYSKGSWAASIGTNYKKRYKFSGKFSFEYAKNFYGERGVDEYSQMQYKVVWSHSQDSKANPNQTFSASVNMSSSGYDKDNSTTSEDYLTTTKSSSISYSRNFENTPFSLSLNFRQSQNSSDSTMSLSLPTATFSMSKIYPFKRKNQSGKSKFYEKFGISYTGNFKNYISGQEDEVWNSSFSKDWKNGVKHSIPISFPSFTLFKFFNFSPGISYNENWYFKKYHYSFDPDGDYSDSPSDEEFVRVDTVSGFNRVYEYSYSVSASTNIYGTYTPRKKDSKVVAIRHKMTPSVSFSYHPDFGAKKYGFYEQVRTDTSDASVTDYFDVYEDAIYGGASNGKSGSIGFSLTNNVEMKMLDTRDSTKRDSDEKYRKVKLLDNLSISSSYNLIADSLNLSVFSVSARTTVGGVGINMSTTVDPYVLNDDYKRINRFAWNERSGIGKLGRITRASLSFSMSFNNKDKDKEGNQQGGANNQQQGAQPGGTRVDESGIPFGPMLPIYDEYADFSLPWNLSCSYSLSYTGPSSSYPNGNVSQTLGVNGSLSLTDKWKMTGRTNFDIQEGEFSYTSFSLNRDLHCWNMAFTFVPFGYRKSYSFTLSCSASILSDLKIQKQQSHYDSFDF
jgi:hypothetical protein